MAGKVIHWLKHVMACLMVADVSLREMIDAPLVVKYGCDARLDWWNTVGVQTRCHVNLTLACIKVLLKLEKTTVVMVSQGEGGARAAGRDFEFIYYFFPKLVGANSLAAASQDDGFKKFT